jgi:hypothetical protein
VDFLISVDPIGEQAVTCALSEAKAVFPLSRALSVAAQPFSVAEHKQMNIKQRLALIVFAVAG